MPRLLSARYGKYRFFDLRHGIVPGLLEFDMWQVRHFGRCNDRIHDRGTIDGECLGDRGHQVIRLLRREAVASAGARQRSKIWVGKFDGLAKWDDTDTFGF